MLCPPATGTLLFIYFGDEMMAVTGHKGRYYIVVWVEMRAIIVAGRGDLTVVSYYYLLDRSNVSSLG